jgi:hypothetical protein
LIAAADNVGGGENPGPLRSPFATQGRSYKKARDAL